MSRIRHTTHVSAVAALVLILSSAAGTTAAIADEGPSASPAVSAPTATAGAAIAPAVWFPDTAAPNATPSVWFPSAVASDASTGVWFPSATTASPVVWFPSAAVYAPSDVPAADAPEISA